MPPWIRFHLSFSKAASQSLSSGERSGFIENRWLKEAFLDSILETSAVRMNFTRMGLGRLEARLNLPSQKQSLMECFWMESSMPETTSETILRSDSKRSYLEVPTEHSSTPKRTMCTFYQMSGDVGHVWWNVHGFYWQEDLQAHGCQGKREVTPVCGQDWENRWGWGCRQC